MVQINVPRYLFEIYYLLSCHQFGKGTVDMDFSLWLHTSIKGTMMLLSLIGALHLDHLEVPDQGVLMNFLAHLHFSKKSSTCCYLPPLLSETRDHLTMALLHEHMHRVFCIVVTLRGDWEDLLCSHKSTFKIYLKSQILNLFEMSNILNLFKMSSSTFV